MNFELPTNTELVSLVFELTPQKTSTIFAQYTVGLHAWFLDQVRQTNRELSKHLHDKQTEKPFIISSLEGQISFVGKRLQLHKEQIYHWYLGVLSPQLIQWLVYWLTNLPNTINLRHAPLEIKSVKIAQPPTTYEKLWKTKSSQTLCLSFVTPTSFRRKKHHLPLPLPVNVFHSYLRRWNNFAQRKFAAEAFLAWVDEQVIITRHQIESVKVAVGKKGSVTGFTGTVEYTLSTAASGQPEYVQLYKTLVHLAPYCGTGHKTTFGLGQTRLGWLGKVGSLEALIKEHQLAQRVEQITKQLIEQQKRTGGMRAIKVCQTRATILARQEQGESLKDIAQDLDMPYETVKTYGKLARRMLKC